MLCKALTSGLQSQALIHISEALFRPRAALNAPNTRWISILRPKRTTYQQQRSFKRQSFE
eukprot:m.114309 g.114309  ORF g.114309 m.114309 type:complete len:60 (-) comp15473_c0_seq2:2252-2431(-)